MFYVAPRLFAAHDRALGALIARRIAAAAGPQQVFLPFCDTDEENLVADVKGRRLFELDTHRLATLSGMLAVLHGPSLDDGVCMEIGYAAALDVPVVALTTDFITHGLSEDGPELHFPAPLVQTVVADIVRASRLGPATAASDPYTVFVRSASSVIRRRPPPGSTLPTRWPLRPQTGPPWRRPACSSLTSPAPRPRPAPR